MNLSSNTLALRLRTSRFRYNPGMPSSTSPPAEAFRAALDLFDMGLLLMRQNLRRRYPDAAEPEIDSRLQQWLRHRPGAEAGDGDGRPADLANRR